MNDYTTKFWIFSFKKPFHFLSLVILEFGWAELYEFCSWVHINGLSVYREVAFLGFEV